MGSSPMQLIGHDLNMKANAVHWSTAWVLAFEAIGDAESARELSAVLTEQKSHCVALQDGLNRMVLRGAIGRGSSPRSEQGIAGRAASRLESDDGPSLFSMRDGPSSVRRIRRSGTGMQPQGRFGRQPLATSGLVVRPRPASSSIRSITGLTPSPCSSTSTPPSQAVYSERPPPASPRTRASRLVGSARLLVADPEDVAGGEQGPDDRIAQRVLRGDGVAGPFLRDVAVVAESGHDGAGGTHQADGHAEPGRIVVAPVARQEGEAVADVADGPGADRDGDDGRVGAMPEEVFRLIDQSDDGIDGVQGCDPFCSFR